VLALGAAAALLQPAGPTRAQLLITGNDEKVSFDENGKTIRHAAGKDTVSIIDIAGPTEPRVVANLPLMNTITGRPSISPSRPTGTWPWSPIRSTGSKTARTGRECPTTRST